MWVHVVNNVQGTPTYSSYNLSSYSYVDNGTTNVNSNSWDNYWKDLIYGYSLSNDSYYLKAGAVITNATLWIKFTNTYSSTEEVKVTWLDKTILNSSDAMAKYGAPKHEYISILGEFEYSTSYQSLDITSTLQNQAGETIALGICTGSSGGKYSGVEMYITITGYYDSVELLADNNFTAQNGTNGLIQVSGYSGNQTAPFPFYKAVGQSVSLTAISPQQDNQGYQRIWHNGTTNQSDWRKDGTIKGTNQTYGFTVFSSDNNARYMANLRKACNVIFQTGGVGIDNTGGTIIVNSTNYSSPTPTFTVVENNSITVTYPFDFWVNNIHYCFALYDWWPRTFTYYPNVHNTYSQNYVGYPDYNLNLRFNSYTVRDTMRCVVLTWDEYPNTAVTQYQVWRDVGVGQGEVLLATLNRGTTTYTDCDYWIRNSSNGEGLR